MKKSISLFIISILALMLVLTGCQIKTGSTGDIYCNDYEFDCCVPTTQSNSGTIGTISNIKCPDNAVSCTVQSRSPTIAHIYTGSVNCRITNEWTNFWISFYKCDNQIELTSFPNQITKGNIVWADRDTQISYVVNGQKLTFCGRAGCTQGVDIKSDSCTFQTNGKIYDSSGAIKANADPSGTLSYTVPVNSCVLAWQSGDRHICGNVAEQCSSNSDCGGHTYGNKECTGRTLQTYGCRQLSLPAGISQQSFGYFGGDSLINNEKNYGTVTKSRCEIISATTVQCCGDTDCGSNAVCDPNTFTCKAQGAVSCTQDYQCGVSTQCNINTKEIVKPVCSFGKCIQQTQSNVQCCGDTDCANGYYCDQDYKCKQSSNPKVACPFECCPAFKSDDNSKYFTKPCVDNRYCTESHVCSTVNPDVCEPLWAIAGVSILPNLACNLGSTFIWIMTALGALVAFFFTYVITNEKNKGKKNRAMNLIISIIVGFIGGLICYLYWWAIIIVLTILIIIKILIKK